MGRGWRLRCGGSGRAIVGGARVRARAGTRVGDRGRVGGALALLHGREVVVLVRLRREDLALVGRAVEVASIASGLDTLAFALPDLAVLVAGRAGRVIARVGLPPALFVRVPASRFIRVAGKFGAAPVGVLKNAVGGSETSLLLACSACAHAALAGRATGVDWRAEHLVWKVHGFLPDVEGQGIVIVCEADMTGNGNGILGSGGALGVQVDLSAAGVELWVRWALVGCMKSKQFRTDEVVTTLDIAGQFDGKMAVVGDELLGAPLLGRHVVIFLKDLEPAVTCGIVALSRIVDLLHVDRARTFVRDVDAAGLLSIGPGAKLKGHDGASVRGTDAIDTILAVHTTSHLFGSDVREREGRLGNVVRHAHAFAVEHWVAIDEEVGESCVGIGSTRQSYC